MRKRLISIILFAAAVAVLIGVLKTLNWVPGVMQTGLLQQYGTIEEVKTRLGVPRPSTPSYYPQGLRWPPVRIMAQTKPHLMILQEFARTKDRLIALVIVQIAKGREAPKLPLVMTGITEQVPFNLKGRDAFLEVGECEGAQCSRVSWDEADSRIMVLMLASPSETVKIADSMIMSP